MAKLSERIEQTVDEAHILVIGTAALIGAEYRSAFEPGFDRLSNVDHFLKLAALICQILALTLLLWPAAFHHIVDRGEDSHRMERFSSGVMDWALLPFALAWGGSIYVAVAKIDGRWAGLASGVMASLVALFMWYGLEYMQARAHAPETARLRMLGAVEDVREAEKSREQSMNAGEISLGAENAVPGTQRTPLEKRIETVLTEVRVVLPGTQALLGFQLAVMFSDGFDKLSQTLKNLHLASLGFIAFSAVCLMAPAAYHRIVFRGQDAEPVHDFSTRMLLSAMFFLGLGLAGDFGVVLRKVTGSPFDAWIGALGLLALCFGAWFAYTFVRRARDGDEAVRAALLQSDVGHAA